MWKAGVLLNIVSRAMDEAWALTMRTATAAARDCSAAAELMALAPGDDADTALHPQLMR